MAERQLPKLNVAGSIPVSRSNDFIAKVIKHIYTQRFSMRDAMISSREASTPMLLERRSSSK